MLAPTVTSYNWNYFAICSPIRPASPSGCVDAVHKIWIFNGQREIALDPEKMYGVAQMSVSGLTVHRESYWGCWVLLFRLSLLPSLW